MQARPAAFEPLEFGGMHDRAELLGEHAVDLGYTGVQGGRQVVRHDDGAIHHLADQLGDNVARTFVFAGGLRHAALFDDLVKQARVELDGLGGCRIAEDG